MINMVTIVDSVLGESWFVQRLSALNLPDDVVLVNANHISTPGSALQDFHGVNEATKAINEGKRAVIYGWMTAPYMYSREDFRNLFADYWNNVRYVRLPSDEQFTEFITAFDQPQFENPALRYADKTKIDARKIGVFIHDIDRHRDRVLTEARNYFCWNGNDEDVEAKLRSYKPSQTAAEGVSFPGVFCDIEGTLIRDDKKNEALLSELGAYTSNKPVNLWTGSDVKRFGNLDVPYPVLSKHDYRGAKVELAIDDLPLEEFENTFDIRPENFRKV